VAIVVLREGVSVTSDDILRFAGGNMASFKVPVSIENLELLPRNSQGKILKAKIKEELKKGSSPSDG
jgi:acyl-CoA synthetase (AMP-forming)/AMP-acid ligase II